MSTATKFRIAIEFLHKSQSSLALDSAIYGSERLRSFANEMQKGRPVPPGKS